MVRTAADYAWFVEEFPSLAEAYCLTLVRDLSPAELIDRVGGRHTRSVRGAAAAVDAAYAHFAGTGGRHQLVAVAPLGPWTLMVEPNGYLGVTEDIALPASRGTSWIAHFVNINALGAFLWAQDGELRLLFDPMAPAKRSGTSADTHLDAVHRAGFPFDESAAEKALGAQAALALAEHLTNVTVSSAFLAETLFLCACVPSRP